MLPCAKQAMIRRRKHCVKNYGTHRKYPPAVSGKSLLVELFYNFCLNQNCPRGWALLNNPLPSLPGIQLNALIIADRKFALPNQVLKVRVFKCPLLKCCNALLEGVNVADVVSNIPQFREPERHDYPLLPGRWVWFVHAPRAWSQIFPVSERRRLMPFFVKSYGSKWIQSTSADLPCLRPWYKPEINNGFII